MADGAIRNQPWCRTCRSGASASKKKTDELEEADTTSETVLAAGDTAPAAVAVEATALAGPPATD
jgi:hypothetical protein